MATKRSSRATTGKRSSTSTPDKRCRRCCPNVCEILQASPPKGCSREDWEWFHQAPDPDRWIDAPTLLAHPSGQFDPNAEEMIIDGIAYTLATDGRTLLRGGKPEIEEVRLDEASPTARASNAKARDDRAKATRWRYRR
jgi:hypothetical protein